LLNHWERQPEISENDLSLLFERINYQDIALLQCFISEDLQDRIWEVLPDKKAQMVKDAQIRFTLDEREERKAKKQFPEKLEIVLAELKHLVNSGDIEIFASENDKEEDLDEDDNQNVA